MGGSSDGTGGTSGSSGSGGQSECEPPGAVCLVGKLLPADGEMDDGFGGPLSLDGDTAVIGAMGDDDNGDTSGSAYVFVRTGTSFTQQQKLLASDGEPVDYFGVSVSVSGNTAVVGAFEEGNDAAPSTGSAYVFVRTGSSWTEQQKLVAGDGAANDTFGASVSVSGDTALIGATADDDNGGLSGSAYFFTRTGVSWTERQKLLPSDGAAGDTFGRSVSLSGDTAIIAAYLDDDNGHDSGSAYVFTRTGSSWTLQQKLLPSDGALNQHFGANVSVSGDTAVIGAYFHETAHNTGILSGSVYVFTRTGSSWTEQQKLLPDDGAAYDAFGEWVSVSGDTVVVGAHGDDTGDFAGSAYVFTRAGSRWSQRQKLFAGEGAMAYLFGTAVSVSGNTALVGSSLDSGSGSAYVFSLPAP
jgi:hypothetical protein